MNRNFTNFALFVLIVVTTFRGCSGDNSKKKATLQPINALRHFIQLISLKNLKIGDEVNDHKAMVDKLKQLKKFYLAEDKKWEKLSKSKSKLLSIDKLNDKVRKVTKKLARYVKEMDDVNIRLDDHRIRMAENVNNTLNGIRKLAKVMEVNADELNKTTVDIRCRHSCVPGLRESDVTNKYWATYYKKGHFDQCYNLAKAFWKAYNDTERRGLKHIVTEGYITEMVHLAAYKLDKIEEALHVCKHGLDNIKLTKSQRTRFQDNFEKYKKAFDLSQKPDGLSVKQQRLLSDAEMLINSTSYKICKQPNSSRPVFADPSLFCRYNNRNRNPVLVLSPVKEEFISVDPFVVILHDIVTSNETKSLKDTAGKHLHSSGVVGQGKSTNIRDSKIAWLDNKLFPKLTKRIEASTGLNPFQNGSEMYQVAYYEIGGHYTPHLDQLNNNGTDKNSRTATLLIYLSDVKSGGGTIFPKLNLHISPVKGSAALWFNFFKNETSDERMLHAACPVLRGEKWAVNKWFRYQGQISHKPCGRDSNTSWTMEDFNLPKWLQLVN